MDRRSELLHQAEIVTVIPELDDLPVGEPEHVDGRETHRVAGRLDSGPWAEVRPRGGPAPRDEVSVGEKEVDLEREIWKGGPKCTRDLFLSLRLASLNSSF